MNLALIVCIKVNLTFLETGELEVVKTLLQKFAKIDMPEKVYRFVLFMFCLSLCTNFPSRIFNGLLPILLLKENIKMW